jgi:sugar phosphate isomerase/epimerase
MLAVLPTTQETSRMPSPALTFSTGSLYLYSLDRCFALAAACGFDGVEVICDQRYDTRQPDNLRRLMDTYGIPVLSLHAPFLNGRLDGWESGERAAIEQTVALAEAIDARHVVMHLPNRIWYMTVSYAARSWKVPARSIHTAIKRWMEDGGLARFQAETPVRVCVENTPLLTRALKDRWLTCWNTLAEWPQVHDYLTLDTTHWATHGIDPLTAYRAGGGRVRHIHLSNYADGQQHLPPQSGDLDLTHFLQTLVAEDFDGQIVVELNPRTLAAWDAGLAHDRVAEAAAFCRAALRH